MKKVIFIDIDGTLRNDKKEITKTTIAALKETKKIGYEIVLCTGRPCDYTKKINIEIGCRYIIYNNGGGIYDTLEKKVLYENSMKKENIITLYNIIENLNVRFIISSNCTTYVNKIKDNEKLIELPIDEFLKTNDVVQVTITSDEYNIIKNMKKDIENIKFVNIINQSKHLLDDNFEIKGTTYYDIVDRNTSKGNAIKYFCELFNISKEDRIGIGDSDNDLTMFLECGFKVAMGNALPELKKYANYITDSNNCDGVAKFLEKEIISKNKN